MCMCVCVCVRVCVHVYAYVRVCVHVYAYVRACVRYVAPASQMLYHVARKQVEADAQYNHQKPNSGSSPRTAFVARAAGAGGGMSARSPGGPGLKLLLYLSYCVAGRAFPRGHIPRRRRASVVAELLSFCFARELPERELRPSAYYGIPSLSGSDDTTTTEYAIEEGVKRWHGSLYPRASRS